MKPIVNEITHLDEQTTMCVDDCGMLTLNYVDDEEDDEWRIEVNARELFEHLREFFDE
jgi:hypothetical protein|tara:strand:+ start:1024 stop:1197 length:174 start_codon:yes stop_codon:yes gene_type:complete